ncbi:MAG: thioester reductase domain-containing protein [Waterburya sp.]
MNSYSAAQIEAWLVNNLCQVLEIEPDEIDITEPLENYGLNSAQAMLLISEAEKSFGFEVSPMLLWYYPTIKALAERLAEECAESTSQEVELPNQKARPQLNLQAEAVLDPAINPENLPAYQFREPKNILVTGATGFLGAFIVWELLQQTQANIYCLVRADDHQSATTRIKNNFKRYAIWHGSFAARVIPVVGDLSKPLLGLEPQAFQNLAAAIDIIYHSGAMLNYVYPYSAAKAANVLGTQEVLRLASQVKIKPVHYVSSVAVFESLAYAGKVVREQDSFDHWEGIYLGYSQTKWVAEKLVKIARERGLPVTIHRPPLIAGHSQTGIFNDDDLICLMLKGCIQMGSFPDLDYLLDMSPVDYVSKAIIYLSQQPESLGKAFHLQHPQPIHLSKIVDWLHEVGYSIAKLPYEQWQTHLKTTVSADNPLFTLQPFLLEKWSGEQLTILELYTQSRRPQKISCEDTLNALYGSGIYCPAIDSELLNTYFQNFVSKNFLTLAKTFLKLPSFG